MALVMGIAQTEETDDDNYCSECGCECEDCPCSDENSCDECGCEVDE